MCIQEEEFGGRITLPFPPGQIRFPGDKNKVYFAAVTIILGGDCWVSLQATTSFLLSPPSLCPESWWWESQQAGCASGKALGLPRGWAHFLPEASDQIAKGET